MVPRVCRMGQAFGRVRRRAFGWTEQQHWQECQQCWQGRQLQSSPPVERQQIDWPMSRQIGSQRLRLHCVTCSPLLRGIRELLSVNMAVWDGR